MKHVDLFFFRCTVLVDSDHGLLAGVDPSLRSSRRFFDAHLRDAGLNGLSHPAQVFHFTDALPCPLGQVVRQAFDEIASAPRIDYIAGVGFLLDNACVNFSTLCFDLATSSA